MTIDSEPATVLIAEDEQPLADLYTRFLESEYTVRTAYDGKEALEQMDDTIDIVLLDRRLPELSGEEVLQTILDDGYDCRVAMVTAVTPTVDIINMGFDDYLTKPASETELKETVEYLLELDAYDDLIQEYYQLTSKQAALEEENDTADLSESEEFIQLTNQLATLEDEIQSKRETAAKADFRNLLGRTNDETSVNSDYSD